MAFTKGIGAGFRGTLWGREVEESAPFFGYSFLEPAQGDGSESLGRGGGGGSKGPARQPS